MLTLTHLDISEKAKVYGNLHTIMMQQFFDEEFDAAYQVAWELLLNPDLPVLIRARCHMVLSTKIGSRASVDHGREAVRILDTDARASVVVGETFPQHQLDEAQELLDAAVADVATLPEDYIEGNEDIEDEEEESVEGDEDVEEVPPAIGISAADRLGMSYDSQPFLTRHII